MSFLHNPLPLLVYVVVAGIIVEFPGLFFYEFRSDLVAVGLVDLYTGQLLALSDTNGRRGLGLGKT